MDTPLLASLRDSIDETFDAALGDATSCALVDYPNHDNVGDNAIWLGERAYLKARGVSVVYACDEATYDRDALAAALDDRPGPILIHGGGNLGDLWEGPQRFRERVISDFLDRQIIQLPQTIQFETSEALDRARRIFDAHPNFALLVRGKTSLDIAEREFQARTLMCPDMAFALGPLHRPSFDKNKIVWISRTDREREHEAPQVDGPGIDVVDWPSVQPPTSREGVSWIAWTLYRASKTQRKVPEQLRGGARKMRTWAFDKLSARRLQPGLDLLGAGEVVVTDRLHGHILSLLMGIPHVLLDNSYGKLSAFHETWTKGWETCVLVHSTEEALERARHMLAGGSEVERSRS